MIIVVEGPDGSGKSTFARALSNFLHCIYIKSEVRPVKDVFYPLDYHRFLRNIDADVGNVVSDRHVIVSEPIYGSIIRGGHILREDDIRRAASDCFAVYCRPPTPTILQNIESSEQMKGVVDNAHDLIREYDRVMLRLPFKQVMTFDYTSQTTNELCQHILQRSLRNAP